MDFHEMGCSLVGTGPWLHLYTYTCDRPHIWKVHLLSPSLTAINFLYATCFTLLLMLPY